MIEPKTQHRVLVVDDSLVSRALLKKTLSDEYDVVEAENGAQALEILREDPAIAAVVLDIRMPVLDGYEVLEAMQADDQLHDIPVIVDTSFDDLDSQIKALESGAVDVLGKPFNPLIALYRVRNAIARREVVRDAAYTQALQHLLQQAEIDEKTGLLGKRAFCREASKVINANTDQTYVIVKWDVDRFKVFNDVFGVQAGDTFLADVGATCKQITDPTVVFGHWDADRFAICMPKETFEASDVGQHLINLISSLHDEFEFVARLGVYEVDDPTIDVALMCDRALLALKSTKGDYSTRVAYYNASMRAALMEEQEIVGEMDRALEQEQFVVYLQPQYNHASKTICGAEALVRWQHPDKGLILPSKFIPAFERNGFISKLDEYVWEQVCKLLRTWLDEGKPVIPLSVNVSRRDMFNPNLCETFEALLQKYHLSHKLLRLEITESAYTENADQLTKTVKTLRGSGFAVEMDDFGSGYSSLNTLKDVPVDTLKLDMKFLEGGDEGTRGGSILTSVIRMANWIGLPLIAEGVETERQADYLKSVGCPCIQGYYYAKPMPIPDFEALVQREQIESTTLSKPTHNIEGAEDFLSASTQSTLLFNSFVGGAAILEFDGTNVEILRLNDRYLEVLGTTWEEYTGQQLKLLDRFDDENRARFMEAIQKAVDTGEEIDCELRSLPLNNHREIIWTSSRMRLLAHVNTRSILYVSIENISQRVKLAERLQSIMDSAPGGILDFEKTDRIRMVYFNDTAATMFGYCREEYDELVQNNLTGLVHPDDLGEVQAHIDDILLRASHATEVTYRHFCADGSWRWVNLTVRVSRRQGTDIFASAILTDIDSTVRTKQIAAQQAEELNRQKASLQALYDSIPYGIMQFAAKEGTRGTGGLISFNDTAWKIYGYASRDEYVEAIHGKSKFKDIYPRDLPELRAHIELLLKSKPGKRSSIEHRIVCQDGSVRWVRAEMQKIHFAAEDDEALQVVFTDITAQKQQDTEKLTSVLFELYDEIFEFDVAEDTCLVRSAKDPDDPRIGKIIPFSKHLDMLCNQYACDEERPRIRAMYEQAGKDNASDQQTIEYRYTPPAGEVRWASTTVVHLSGTRYLVCNRDITDQKATERLSQETTALREQIADWTRDSERIRILVEQADLITFDYDPASDVLKIQRKNTHGGIIEEVTKHYLATIDNNTAIGLEDRPRVQKAFLKLIKQPDHEAFEYRSNRFGNGFHPCFMLMGSAANQDGAVYRIVGQTCYTPSIDSGQSLPSTTERQKQLDELNRYAATLFGVFDEVLEMDFGLDLFVPVLSKHVYVLSEEAHSSLAEATQRWTASLPNANDRANVIAFMQLDAIQASFSNGVAPLLEYEVIAPDGSHHRCLSTLLQIDANRYLCCNKDITESRTAIDLDKELHALQATVEEQDRYRIVVEQSGTAVIDMDYRTGTFSTSEAYQTYELSRHTYESVLSNTADHSLVHPDDQDKLESFFAAVNNGSPHAQAELRLKTIDGAYRWTRMTGSFFRDERSHPTRTVMALADIDEEMRAKTASEQLANRLNRIVTSIPTGVIIYEMGPQALPIYISDRAGELLGLTRAICDLSIANGTPIGFAPDKNTLTQNQLARLQAGIPVVVDRFRPQGGRTAHRTWLRAFCNMGENRNGKALCYAVIADVTGEVERDQERTWQAEKYRMLSESTDAVTFDYSPLDDVMRVTLAMPEKDLVEEVYEHYLATFDKNAHIPAHSRLDFAKTLRGACRSASSGVFDFESDYYHDDLRWYRARYTSLADESGRVYRVVGRLDDINDIMAKQKQLRTSAQVDGISGTYNKNYAVSTIKDALAAKDSSHLDAVIFLGIDNFKSLNDTYGHLKADDILRNIGEILNDIFRRSDIVARFGGDEFIVYMRSVENLDRAEDKARSILEAVGSIQVEGDSPVRCSIGIAGITGEHMSYDKALGHADKALYEAKRRGKNCYAVYNDQ